MATPARDRLVPLDPPVDGKPNKLAYLLPCEQVPSLRKPYETDSNPIGQSLIALIARRDEDIQFARVFSQYRFDLTGVFIGFPRRPRSRGFPQSLELSLQGGRDTIPIDAAVFSANIFLEKSIAAGPVCPNPRAVEFGGLQARQQSVERHDGGRKVHV